jgi:hypothetical protein
MLRYLLASTWLVFSGCAMLPEIVHQPTLHNPFPQLSKVAVAPFFNLSHEPTLDGRKVASAYFNELQLLPGFEVVPVGVVEQAMRENHISLRGAADARRLAQILGVDAVVIGAVTDYSPYYPPRMALQVEWYAANPNFHPIPPGYGLPWGTPAEKDIPGPLVFEAELALAKAQLETQTPAYDKLPAEVPSPLGNPAAVPGQPAAESQGKAGKAAAAGRAAAVRTVAHQEPAAGANPGSVAQAAVPGSAPQAAVPGLPPDWPDPRGLVPPPPLCRPPAGHPTEAPVLRHTRTYNGHDPEFVEALENYCYFRNDARLGGWQGYLQRSDDFMRFCCHTHLWEMLAARGGAGETRVVWRWSGIR